MRNLVLIILALFFLSACSSTGNSAVEKRKMPRNTNELVNSMISTCSGFSLLLAEQGKGNYQVIFDECLSRSKKMAKNLAHKYK